MDDQEKHVRAAIIDRYLTLLRNELDPDRQGSLRRLLVEEEDRLGRDREQLDLAARRVRDGQERLARLWNLVEEPSFGETPFEQNLLRLVANMEVTQGLLESFHRKLQDQSSAA